MIAFTKIDLPSGELTNKELAQLKSAVEGLAAQGQWKPSQEKVMGVKTLAGSSVFQTISPSNAMVGMDPMAMMVRNTAFVAYAPQYVSRLVEEVEKLRRELGRSS